MRRIYNEKSEEINTIANIVNISPNDYKIPTEIRIEVVEAICNHFLRGAELVFYKSIKKLFYYPQLQIIDVTPSFQNQESVRVHSIEVQTAFIALERKGYSIKKIEGNDSNKIIYQLRKIDVDFDGKFLQRRDFDLCIDEP